MKKAAAFLLLVFCTVHAAEYIDHFDSSIAVNKNGSMDVTEIITYSNTDRYGLHGIVREFPTRYRGPYNTEYTIGFTVTDIKRDGKPVPYHIKYDYSGARIFIGSRDTLIPPGTYTYTLSYTTTRQLGSSDKNDILYWNVTGNGWDFPIKQTTANIILPKEIYTGVVCECYTGRYGSTQKKCSCMAYQNKVTVKTSTTLQPGMGLTTFITWPVGYITHPTQLQEILWYAYDNSGFLLLIFGILFMLLYYLFMYWRIRKQEQKEPVIPLFYPPKNISPGALHYFLKQDYRPRQFAAEIVDLAVHGLIDINHQKQWWTDTYTIKKKESDKKTKIETTELHETLLKQLLFKNPELELSKTNQKKIKRVSEMLAEHYSETYQDYFINNYHHSVIPLILLVIIVFMIIAYNPHIFDTIFSLWFILPALFIAQLFFSALKSYTIKGCKIRNEILGFKMFLAATETERLKLIGTPPTRTPELYEKYLPYAIALGVEKAWSQQFASVFRSLEKTGVAYYPIWYHGRSFGSFNATAFSGQISNSLQSAVKSSGGSKSGGGGGFSGGGRGGGGGGSW